MFPVVTTPTTGCPIVPLIVASPALESLDPLPNTHLDNPVLLFATASPAAIRVNISTSASIRILVFMKSLLMDNQAPC